LENTVKKSTGRKFVRGEIPLLEKVGRIIYLFRKSELSPSIVSRKKNNFKIFSRIFEHIPWHVILVTGVTGVTCSNVQYFSRTYVGTQNPAFLSIVGHTCSSARL
jgi:hypothetical protein